MKERDTFIHLCLHALEARGLNKNQQYKDRLKYELRAVDQQGEHQYYINLYNRFRKENLIFPKNEHNLLIAWLLDLAPDFNIDQEPAWVMGELPDVDVDYIKEVRDYMKREWAPKTFGREHICEIGTYGTSGIKGSLLDMARVHGLDIHEPQSITVKMEDKDDEGKDLEWAKALEIYPEFNKYCASHPEVADAAALLQGRNRTAGVHAGGLIISSVPLDGFVPLEVRMVNKDNPNGVVCSAWTEGLNAQDLGPVGLIKFDLLVISNLMQIALACDLVKKRHGIEHISALPGDWDWSDISYLNDPKSLQMANDADLKCIFQFDSEGIRKMVKRGGVSSFDDLAAYSALYRPGPLNMGMDARYCKRKKGDEPWNVHPLLQPILGKTYGVMIYQEQVMDMLRAVGNVPDMHTEKVRKAISKKKIDQFIKYKEMFVENGKVNLGVNAEFCIDLWNQIESFAEYGFNKSHAYAYTYISARLLYLKAHYPLEFYTAILMCEKDDKKFREYKLDAKYHEVPVKPVHINKSRSNFHIEGNEIFFGFKNIKSIGEAVADRIVENQPYRDFPDFLERFGTDATPIKALTSLGVFEETYDRLTLRKFSEYYKEASRKRRDRQKRFEASMDKKLEELRELLLTVFPADKAEVDPDFEKMVDFSEEAEKLWDGYFETCTVPVEYRSKGETKTKHVPFTKLLKDLAGKRASSIKNFYEKEKEDDESPITLDQFNPSLVKIDEEEEELLTDKLELDGQITYPKAESKYYGFQWTHLLETCVGFEGHTIDKLLEQADLGLAVGPIEVQINSVKKRVSKPRSPDKPGVEFWSIEVEDANARTMFVNIWKDDYTRWQEELKKGNFVRMRVRPPSGGFNTLTFDSFPRNNKKNIPLKEDDHRLIVLQLPEKPKPEKVKVDLDAFTFDADAVKGIDL